MKQLGKVLRVPADLGAEQHVSPPREQQLLTEQEQSVLRYANTRAPRHSSGSSARMPDVRNHREGSSKVALRKKPAGI